MAYGLAFVMFRWQSAMYQRIGNMPKACPYVMIRKFSPRALTKK